MSTPHMSELTVTALRRTGHTEQEQFFELVLACDASCANWEGWKPGQFAMLRPAGWALDMPWARPLSICQVTDDTLLFFFQVAGRGTARMAGLVPGDVVHIWGPLGNGFAVQAATPTLLLAGGIGIAPFVGYAQGHPRVDQLSMLFGHRAAAQVYPLEALRAAGVRVEQYPECSLEDREHFLREVRERMVALGASGPVVAAPQAAVPEAAAPQAAAPEAAAPEVAAPEAVAPEVAALGTPAGQGAGRAATAGQGTSAAAVSTGLVLACGPEPFLRYVQSVALECGVRTQLSLETRMACGVGACLGCVVTPTEKNTMAGAAGLPQRTCVNGPVFWADQIVIGQ